MLLEVLRQIRDMQFFSLTKLANALNIDTSMASHMVEQLKVMGYLREETIDASCSSCCTKCSSCPATGSLMPTNTLIITEKGNKALQRLI